MASENNKNLKTYYSIKEVSQMIGVSEPTLRYWEAEFPYLRPRTLSNRVRQYTERDIEEIRRIYILVKVRGFKIAAAKKLLSANRDIVVDKRAKVIEKLTEVRDQLQEMKDTLDKIV